MAGIEPASFRALTQGATSVALLARPPRALRVVRVVRVSLGLHPARRGRLLRPGESAAHGELADHPGGRNRTLCVGFCGLPWFFSEGHDTSDSLPESPCRSRNQFIPKVVQASPYSRPQTPST